VTRQTEANNFAPACHNGLTPGRIWRGAPSIGEDTTEILSKMLSLSEPDINKLYEEKVVHCTEPFITPQVEAINP
jgi:crotonobetainyl-CoA:carnitine CoA-transferase CaiB-like acyl-CoA transferase